jgi:hypothetical protein
MQRRLVIVADAVMVGWATGVVVFLLLSAVTIAVEVMFAGRPSQSPLPPPSSAWVYGPTLVAAALVGAFVAVQRLASYLASLHLSAVALVIVAVVAGSSYWYDESQEKDFLASVQAGTPAGSQALLGAGDRACDWLRGQPWGEPPRNEGVVSGIAADTLHAMYLNELVQSGDRLTAEEQLSAQLAVSAWTDLCPFQREVHRQVGGSGDD